MHQNVNINWEYDYDDEDLIDVRTTVNDFEHPIPVAATPAIIIPGPSSCRLCSESTLRNNVFYLGLSFDGNHVDSSAISECESLLLAMGRNDQFDSNQALRLMSALQSNSILEGVSYENLDWYKQLVNNEYGCHELWCIPGIMPTVATLALLAIFFEINIFVVTNDFTLNSYHKGTNVIKFPTLTAFASNCVISIGGFGIFHSLCQPEAGSETWSRIERLSFAITESTLNEMPRLLNIPRVRREFDIPTVIESADPIDPVQGTEETLGESNLNLPPIDNESLHIRPYLALHTSVVGTTLNISPTAYTNNSKILLHNVEEFDCTYRQSFDIDGLFIIEKWERISESCRFNCHALLNPSAISKTELATIRKQYKEAEIGPIGPISACKIATIDSTFGPLDFYCVIVAKPEDISSFQAINLTKVFIDAIQFSISARCYDLNTNEDHHPNCSNPSHRITANGIRKNWEDAKGTLPLDKESFKCFSNHIGRFVRSFIRAADISEPALYFFVKGVGMKFNFIEDDLHSLASTMDEIGTILNLKLIKPNYVFLDFCITSLCIPEDDIEKVNMR